MQLDYLMGATIAVLLVALLRVVLQPRPDYRLAVYLLSELVATIGIEISALTWPDWNDQRYAGAFCVSRTIDLTAAIWLSRPRVGTVISALLITAIAIIGVRGHLDLNSSIALAEGFGFILAGMSILLQPVSFTRGMLAILWVMLAAYNYGYAMSWHLELADYWNTVVCIGVFSLIAIVGSEEPYGQVA